MQQRYNIMEGGGIVQLWYAYVCNVNDEIKWCRVVTFFLVAKKKHNPWMASEVKKNKKKFSACMHVKKTVREIGIN